nr:NRDE family protein [Halogeometricum sp. CBA1124]
MTIAWQVFEEAPVVVAANRDELTDRPSEPPSVVEGDPAFVAPRDAEAGGDVGRIQRARRLRRRHQPLGRGGGRRRTLSRSTRPRRLRAESAAAARETVEAAVAADTYDGFNLVVADAADAFLFEWDGTLSTTRLTPGVHVVVNVGADGDYFEPARRPEAGREQADNARRVREALEPRERSDRESADAWRERAASVLRDHDYGVCVHDPEGRYGTRSSSLVTLRADGDADYAFAPGPPCETAYEPVESQV